MSLFGSSWTLNSTYLTMKYEEEEVTSIPDNIQPKSLKSASALKHRKCCKFSINEIFWWANQTLWIPEGAFLINSIINILEGIFQNHYWSNNSIRRRREKNLERKSVLFTEYIINNSMHYYIELVMAYQIRLYYHLLALTEILG